MIAPVVMLMATILDEPPPAVAPVVPPDVVVTARREHAPSLRSETRAITATFAGQIARFETPVCPRVVGLSDVRSRVVEERMRTVVAEAGVRVDRIGCRPNLTLFVADDGPAFIRALRSRRPRLFDSMDASAFDRLTAGRGPVWNWSETSPRRADGGPVEQIRFVDFSDEKPPQPTTKRAYTVQNAEKTRIGATVRQDVDLAFVVLSASAIDGLTLRQVADYATVVGLAFVRPDAAANVDEVSVLTMFADRSQGRLPQPGATVFDMAYLRGFYTGKAGVSSDYRTTEIAQFIERMRRAGSP